jgi:DNA (cytosine-5)-methyltransferase 1
MRTLTLFAGAGGADIGLQAAGCHHAACVEGDRNAVATLVAAGFPGAHAWIGTPPEGSDVPAWAWDGLPVDLLWASPPCQPYSQAGKMLGADDPRDGWLATLATIRQVRPRWVIIENVGGSPIEAWAADLGPSMFWAGLYPHASTRLLDAADWGLPSHRRREFLVAGPVPYKWPEPTHCGPDAPVAARMRLSPWNGFGAALGLVDVVARQDRGAGMMERHGEPTVLTPDQPMGALRCGGQGGYVLLPGNGGHLPAPRCASEPAHTVTGSCPQYLMQPSPTICCVDGVGLGSAYARDHIEKATGRRRLTWQECATLVGFPDDYPFQGTIEARYRQVGNAVAPIMAEALARSIPREAP